MKELKKGVVALAILTLVSVACTGEEGVEAADGSAEAPAAEEVTSAPSSDSGEAEGLAGEGRWEGVVTGGYDGNVISFVLTPENAITDITFEGHWDCADGIEMTVMGPSESYPVQAGAIDVTSVDPPDGGATATRFIFNGRVGADDASGTLRANINALGCDTGELSWQATPAR